jgi:hypothetical protein
MAGGVSLGITKTYTGVADLLNSTRERMPDNAFTETAALQAYEAASAFFDGAQEKASSGTRYEARVRVRSSNTFAWTQMYATTGNTQQDVMVVAAAPWRHFEAKTHYDEREILMNSDPDRIIDLMIERESAAMEDIYNNIERASVNAPPSSGDGDVLYGLGYWLSPCGTVSSSKYVTATDTVGGFNGQAVRFADGSASYTVGNIDASNAGNSRWRNWCATHNGTMTPDTVDQIRTALTRTKFKLPPKLEGKSIKKSGGLKLFMSMAFADQYERLVNNGPDDLNGDAAGQTNIKLRGIPILRVPALDELSYLPIYGVDTRHIFGITLKNQWMKSMPAINDRDSVQVYTKPIVGSGQMFCDDRRGGGFVIHGVIASTP